MNLTEKIIARAAGQERVSADQIVTASVDCAMAHDMLGPKVFADTFERLGGKIWDRRKAVIVADHYFPAGTVAQADVIALTRKWAREHGVENYYEGEGPCHQILAEKGYDFPGTLVVGTDSHTCSSGAFGCLGTGIGSTEMAAVLATGQIWLRVPRVILVLWNGKLQRGVMAKDMILKVIGDIGHAGATYMALEFAGSTADALPMDERLCMSNMSVEAGAKAGIFAADETTRLYLAAHGCERGFEPLRPDANADYEKVLSYDAEALVPQVACPHGVDRVKSVSEVAGVPIQCAYIGSCTGGRLHDLKAAVKLLRGRKIASGCRLLVSPASKRIWSEADRQGILGDLADAGATILPPTCGACAGVHSGLLAAGENCVSSTNRNFRGRMGSRDACVYLASPATAAASALRGRLTDCRELLQEG